MSKIGVDSIKIKVITLEGNFNKEDLLVFEEPREIRIGFGFEPEKAANESFCDNAHPR